MEHQGLRGSRPRELPRANRTYEAGRVCAREGCETRISRYNKGEFCFTHAPLRYPLIRGLRRRKSAA